MLANRNGQKLVAHLRLVGHVALEMARRAGMEEELQKMCEYAGYAHDLGKCVSWFQKHIRKTNDQEGRAGKPLHHEISWAYLASKYDRDRKNKMIMNAVYWHHSRPVNERGESYENSDLILQELTESDIKSINNIASKFDWSEGFIVRDDFEADAEPVPDLFERESDSKKNVNAMLLAIRTCLISADRCVSALTADEFNDAIMGKLAVRDIVQRLMHKRFPAVSSLPQGYDRKRFAIQNNCSTEAFKEKTVIVRAPAGFGKTIIGLLWGLKSNERFLWVCPRNVVAEEVYRNITKELMAMGLNDVSAELHLTGERKSAIGNREEFCSDIVVTNIDTILRPMIDNRIADRLFTVLSSSVVLDEFHEFASEQPLFAAFITLMRARHRLCKEVKTLLLSATPMSMQELWDTDGNKTVNLPSDSNHYPAAHRGNYSIRITCKLSTQSEPGSLTIVNSIKRAQDVYKKHQMDYIVHSRFTDTDRKRIIDGVFSEFGKSGDGVSCGKRVVSALVIQAAMDVSFPDLYESVCSPEYTLQRIGRCNRWGNYQHLNPKISIMAVDDPHERGAIIKLYDMKLRNLWLDHLKAIITKEKEMCLDNLYDTYNSFYEGHKSEIKSYLRNKYLKGLDYLREYYPIKLKIASEKDERLKGGRNLRNPFGSYFFSVQKDDGQWLGPDDVMDEVELRGRYENSSWGKELFDADKMLFGIKGLYEAGFLRYRRYFKRGRPPNNLKAWFKLARSAETPLPDFSRRYNSEIGLYGKEN